MKRYVMQSSYSALEMLESGEEYGILTGITRSMLGLK